jgi:hypothetical protein
LPFEGVLQEYLQLPYKYFILVLLFGVIVVTFALQRTLDEETTRIKNR